MQPRSAIEAPCIGHNGSAGFARRSDLNQPRRTWITSNISRRGLLGLGASVIAVSFAVGEALAQGRGTEQRSDRADERSRRPASPPSQAKKADDDKMKKAGDDKTKKAEGTAPKKKKTSKAKTKEPAKKSAT